MLHTRPSGSLVQICCSSFVWSFVALLRDEVMKSKHLETLHNLIKVSAFHRTFEVFEIGCSQKEQKHSKRTRRITDNPSISTENNHLLEHPPSLTLDSAKKIESVTPDYRTPECGIRYTLIYPFQSYRFFTYSSGCT